MLHQSRRWAFLLFLAVIAANACAPRRGGSEAEGAARRVSLPPEYVEVPLVRDRNYALIPVSVAGHDSLWFILDTAAGGSVISPAVRDLIGFDATRGTTATIVGASGETTYQTVTIDSLGVGGFVRGEVNVTVIDLQRFQTPVTGRTFAGILGNDFLQHFDLMLDLPNSVIRLYPRAQGVSSLVGFDDSACVPNRAEDAGWVKIDLLVAGHPVQAILDTGAGRSVFNWNAARQAGVEQSTPGVTRSEQTTRGLGTDAAETHYFTFENIEAGGTRLLPTESRIADLSIFRALGLADVPAVILGNNYLEDRTVAISYSTRQVCFGKVVR